MFASGDDSLIAYGWENLLQILSIMLFLSVVGIVGFLSRKLENALLFTIICSLVIFGLYLITLKR